MKMNNLTKTHIHACVDRKKTETGCKKNILRGRNRNKIIFITGVNGLIIINEPYLSICKEYRAI